MSISAVPRVARTISNHAPAMAVSPHASCEKTVEDGNATWRLLHRGVYRPNATAGEYAEYARSLILNFPCPRCNHKGDAVMAQLAKLDAMVRSRETIQLDTDTQLRDDVVYWGFVFHQSIATYVKETGGYVSGETEEMMRLFSKADVVHELDAKYSDKCSAPYRSQL